MKVRTTVARATTMVLLLSALVLTARGADAADPCPGRAVTDDPVATARGHLKRAACYENEGRPKSATDQYAAFLKALRRVDAAARKDFQTSAAKARERVKALGSRVPLLTIELPGDPSDYEVTLDGQELSTDGLEYARPIDPGRHRIEVELPDGSVQRFDETLAEGESRVIRVTGESASDDDDDDDDDDEPTEDEAADDATPIPMRTWAYVAGGVGTAGILVGAITGGMALGKKSTLDDNCEGEACNAEGKAAADALQDLAMGSNIGFAIGLTGLAAGAAIWFLFPDDEAEEAEEAEESTSALRLAPWVGATGIGLRGSW